MMDQPHSTPGQSAVDACFHHLRHAIVSRRILAHHRLPPERELAAQLGVNRTTLRQALTRLEVAGLIVARQGSGTVVRDFRHAAGPELVPELLRQARDPLLRRQLVDDLLLMRRQMFAVVFARLADGVSPLARAHVAAAVDVLAELGAGAVDSAAFSEADLAVVAALLDATESPVLALCLNPVNDVVRRDPDLHGAMYADPRPHVQGWLEVCDWLAAPDPGGIAGLLAAVDARDAATVDRLAG